MSFTGKVVLVTGGSSGIGAAAAIKFCEEDAKVAIVGRNANKLKTVASKCGKNKPYIIIAELTKEEEIKPIIDQTIAHYGKLNVLVNCAGIVRSKSILSHDTLETYDLIMAINLRAIVYLTHLAAPHLISTKGCIVNVSSASSTAILYIETAAYCASKAALDQFTKAVAIELASEGVRVNSVNPGPVKTDCLNDIVPNINEQEQQWKQMAALTPLKKLSQPEEIADVILYLASDKAKSITGSSFVIDNGILLKH